MNRPSGKRRVKRQIGSLGDAPLTLGNGVGVDFEASPLISIGATAAASDADA